MPGVCDYIRNTIFSKLTSADNNRFNAERGEPTISTAILPLAFAFLISLCPTKYTTKTIAACSCKTAWCVWPWFQFFLCTSSAFN